MELQSSSAYFRTFFSGNIDACRVRMKVLEKVVKINEDSSLPIEDEIRKLGKRESHESDDDYISTLKAINDLGKV